MKVDFDLIIRAGRVFCADTGIDGPGAVAVKDGRIVASGPDVTGSAQNVFDFPDCVLLPGLIDMHTHPAPSIWKYGIDPDVEILPRGRVASPINAPAMSRSQNRTPCGFITGISDIKTNIVAQPSGCAVDQYPRAR